MAKKIDTAFKATKYTLLYNPKNKVGSLTIEGQKLPPPSKRIALHQQKIKIMEVNINSWNKKNEFEADIIRINYIKAFQEVRIHTQDMLYPGPYTINIKYIGSFTDKDLDLLNSPLNSWRAIMPCIDAPEARADAEVTVSLA